MIWLDYFVWVSISWFFMSVPILIGIGVLFGRLIKLQFKYWTLAKRGYHKIEHIGIDKVIRTFFLRPRDDHFIFEDGIYFQQKDALFKSGKEVIKPIPTELLSKDIDENVSAEDKELIGLLKQVGKMKYDSDSVFLQWGIPTMFYYGNDPNPINPADRKRLGEYDSKVMFAYIKRIMLEKEWKFVKFVLTLTLIGFGIALVLGALYWGTTNNMTNQLAICQAQANVSNNALINYLNATAQRVIQNNTIIL